MTTHPTFTDSASACTADDLAITGPVLGTMTFGDTVDADTAASMVDLALDSGIRHVDTANAYAGGETERLLGRILAGRRDDVVIATKAGMPHPDTGDHALLSPAAIRACVEGSLSRLGTDRVDVFYLHQPDRSTPLSETLSTVAELVAEGKIGALGVSNFAAWQIGDVVRVASEVGAPEPVVAQQLYNLVARRIEDEYVEFATTAGIATMVYNPLGGGLLTGRHQYSATPDDGRFGDSRLAAMYRERYWNQGLFDAIAALTAIAEEAGIPMVELALRWLVSRPVTSSILLGGSAVGQLRSNLDALSRGPLPDDVVAACDEVGAALRGPMPAYNR